MRRDHKRHLAGGNCANSRFTTIKRTYLDGYLMSRLSIDSEIMAAAAPVRLRLSGQNGMSNNCQNEMCRSKTKTLPRKTNISGMDLSTEDAAREKPFADVSFSLDKTPIFGNEF